MCLCCGRLLLPAYMATLSANIGNRKPVACSSVGTTSTSSRGACNLCKKSPRTAHVGTRQQTRRCLRLVLGCGMSHYACEGVRPASASTSSPLFGLTFAPHSTRRAVPDTSHGSATSPPKTTKWQFDDSNADRRNAGPPFNSSSWGLDFADVLVLQRFVSSKEEAQD